MRGRAREEVLQARLEAERAQFELAVFKAQNESLRDERDKLVERVHELEIANAVYKERLDLLTQLPQFGSEPHGDLGLSEDREDLEHALRAGLIDDEQFQAELEAAGLMNTTIEFAPEDYPRLGRAR